MDVCNYFLCELKDQGTLVIKHIPDDTNDADVFTKKVTSTIFNCHIPLYVGYDEYLVQHRASSGVTVNG